jgi:hypothetical protein
MYHEEQAYWIDLVNLAGRWRDDEDIARFIPLRHRDFESAPQWSRRKACAFLVNNLDVLRDSHRRLESGRQLEFDLLNNILGGLRLRLFDWGDRSSIAAVRKSKAGRGSRLETLQVLGQRNGLNPGTCFVRSCVERAFFYFAQYVDHRLDDPAYPEVSPGRTQVRLCESCGSLFVRTDERPRHCSAGCALGDGPRAITREVTDVS